ncbi:MAG: pyrroloquinoline quinone biosynthesis protein PqqE [Burkholderiales bacterium]
MKPSINPPLWLLAEVTYKCPLHCVFCSNPVDYAHYDGELTTDDWVRVLREGRAMGAAQLGLSGGEPLMRDDLEVIVGEARKLGYYSNLITSGIGLNEKRIAQFKQNGLDHIQLSFQDSTRELNDFLSSTRTFELKSRVAKLIKQYDYPMVLNVVLHRMNIDHVKEILEMAESMEAEYVELANTQYYGWAMLNRDHLLPSREQIQRAEHTVNEFRRRIGDKMKIYFVVPDYYETRPKACMNGWGSVFITITADGVVLPCHEARMLPGLTFPNVRDADLKSIWYDSQAFNAYRGDSWMKEPCRTCPDKVKDFGGCRCQAFMLTGDAANADPVCGLSPHHHVINDAISKSKRAVAQPTSKTIPIIFRDDANSRIHGKPPAKQNA